MGNRLFNQYGRRNVNAPGIQNGRFQSMNQFVDQFNEFKKNMTENPEQKVQELLDSGAMSQQQYNMLYGLAKKIMAG